MVWACFSSKVNCQTSIKKYNRQDHQITETTSFQPDSTNMDASESSDGSEMSSRDVNSCMDNEYSNATAEIRRSTKGEDRSVFWSSLVVKVTKIVVAIALTVLIYWILKSAESIHFHAAVSA